MDLQKNQPKKQTKNPSLTLPEPTWSYLKSGRKKYNNLIMSMLKIKSAAFFRNFHKIAPKTFQPTFFPKRDRIENVKVYQNYSGNAELPF